MCAHLSSHRTQVPFFRFFPRRGLTALVSVLIAHLPLSPQKLTRSISVYREVDFSANPHHDPDFKFYDEALVCNEDSIPIFGVAQLKKCSYVWNCYPLVLYMYYYHELSLLFKTYICESTGIWSSFAGQIPSLVIFLLKLHVQNISVPNQLEVSLRRAWIGVWLAPAPGLIRSCRCTVSKVDEALMFPYS
jgi:hypothetical protein